MEAWRIDGNNVLEVYDTVRNLAISLRNRPRPVILECITFRMRGHEEASGVKYVPKNLFEEWGKKDPLMNFENFLLEKNILSEEKKKSFHAEIKTEIETAIEKVFAEEEIVADTEEEISSVYSKSKIKNENPDRKLFNALLIWGYTRGKC
mgnify:CR=1 FL=1